MNVARLGDRLKGVCSVHGAVYATILTASSTEFVNGFGVARLGDIAYATCGHTGKIVTCSATHFVDGLGVARLGDTTSGIFTGTIITGSPDTFAT